MVRTFTTALAAAVVLGVWWRRRTIPAAAAPRIYYINPFAV